MSNRKYRHFFYVPQSVYIYFIEMKGLSRDDQWSYYNVSIDILIQSSKIINYIFKSTALCETALSYTKQTTINKQILCRFQKKKFSKGPKNYTHLLFFDVLLLVGHFFELKNFHVRSFYVLRTHKRSSDGIFSSHPLFINV